ncbi:hypothetical protein CBR_g41735 [Chara braunii]|uniref:CCHC-type domain-containing protein n=1 Tax=Chara braunii TaxID=69332 RepID=A0A388LWN8_CHABU|nr:hypothetical protein CBR_g41735 [Chara braunii]|eukprot:GBG86673.1 hypothetical protein CBR_g41735 [Chara braunii]
MGSNGNGRGQWNGPGNGENGGGNNGGNGGNWNQGGQNGNGGGGGGWNGNSNGGGNGGNGWNLNNRGNSWNGGNGGNNWNGNGGNGGNGGWNGNGGNGWNNNGGNQGSSSKYWRRSAKCYNCHRYGHISQECNAPRQGNNQGNQGNSYQGNHGNQGGGRAPHDGASTSSSSNEAAVAVGLSKELEEGIRQMCKYTTKQLELEEKKEAEKKVAEEKKKREDEEKAAKEEKSRVEFQKKKAKEEKEADREWKLEMLLAKQKESLKEEFERMFEARLRRMVVSERAVKGKAKVTESESDEEPEDPEERLEKRKRQPQQACQVSPQGATPTKVGRGATNDGIGFPLRESSLWEGAPVADDFNTVIAFKKEIRRFLGKKLKATIEAMCHEAGVVYRGRPEAVDELTELRAMYFSASAPQDSSLPKVEGHVLCKLSDLRNLCDFVRNARNIVCENGTRRVGRLMQEINDSFVKMGLNAVVDIREAGICVNEDKKRPRKDYFRELNEVKALTKDLVCSAMDRNSAETGIMCPVVYAKGMKTMFWKNESFEAVWESEAEVLEGCKKAYKEAGLDRLGRWDSKGRCGRAYIIPKSKDICRFRPISPSYPEPSKTASSRTARALNHLLFLLPKSMHFNLKATGLLKDRMREVDKWVEGKGKGRLEGAAYDIKEMFSQLPHDSIIAAVEWILEWYQAKGKTMVTVKRRGKGSSFAQKDGLDTWMRVGFDEIRAMVEVDQATGWHTNGEEQQSPIGMHLVCYD